ncbi:MAG: nucleotidyltransferase domain-containing protein [Clostridiales bacterium]|jgi:predicted nucleotidyltransferase|nr:nucleotidyltransferase domain-containing protein [Clostridiales bacterium]
MLLDSGERVAREFEVDSDVGDPLFRWVHPRRQLYVKALFENRPKNTEQLWVFGSAVTPNHTTDSDLDALILGDISISELTDLRDVLYETSKADTWNVNKSVDMLSDTVANFDRWRAQFGHCYWYVWKYGIQYYDMRWLDDTACK